MVVDRCGPLWIVEGGSAFLVQPFLSDTEMLR